MDLIGSDVAIRDESAVVVVVGVVAGVLGSGGGLATVMRGTITAVWLAKTKTKTKKKTETRRTKTTKTCELIYKKKMWANIQNIFFS